MDGFLQTNLNAILAFYSQTPAIKTKKRGPKASLFLKVCQINTDGSSTCSLRR